MSNEKKTDDEQLLKIDDGLKSSVRSNLSNISLEVDDDKEIDIDAELFKSNFKDTIHKVVEERKKEAICAERRGVLPIFKGSDPIENKWKILNFRGIWHKNMLNDLRKSIVNHPERSYPNEHEVNVYTRVSGGKLHIRCQYVFTLPEKFVYTTRLGKKREADFILYRMMKNLDGSYKIDYEKEQNILRFDYNAIRELNQFNSHESAIKWMYENIQQIFNGINRLKHKIEAFEKRKKKKGKSKEGETDDADLDNETNQDEGVDNNNIND